MSTRATVHFQYKGITEAIVYRHSDGYPEGLGTDLETFFKEVSENLKDTRFDTPTYLAAKFVVWDSAHYLQETHPLSFRGVGIVMEDPSDIEFRYLVKCSDGSTPKIVVEKV